jgi:hypothetical protein
MKGVVNPLPAVNTCNAENMIFSFALFGHRVVVLTKTGPKMGMPKYRLVRTRSKHTHLCMDALHILIGYPTGSSLRARIRLHLRLGTTKEDGRKSSQTATSARNGRCSGSFLLLFFIIHVMPSTRVSIASGQRITALGPAHSSPRKILPPKRWGCFGDPAARTLLP